MAAFLLRAFLFYSIPVVSLLIILLEFYILPIDIAAWLLYIPQKGQAQSFLYLISFILKIPTVRRDGSPYIFIKKT